MIDIEADVFNTVATALRTEFTGIAVYGEYIDTPARFPCVTLVEADNRVNQEMRTTNIENAVNVMYEMNVFSNKTSGKKAEAKAIVAAADEVMTSMGFTRTFREQVANLRDASIYRIVCRYEAVIDKDFWIYQI